MGTSLQPSKKLNFVDRVLDYLLHDNVGGLHENDLERYQRVEFAYGQLERIGFETNDIVTLLKKKFDISWATAERDIREAKFILGKVRSIQVELELPLRYERAIKLAAMAQRAGDYRAAASHEKNALKALELMRDANIIDLNKLKPHQNILMINIGAETAIQLDLNHIQKVPEQERLRVEHALKDFYDRQAEDAIFEEVKNPDGD